MCIKHLCDYGNVAGKILTEEYSEPRDLLTVNYFSKKLHLRFLTEFWICFWLTITFIKFRKISKDGAYKESKRYYESNDYSSTEEDNFLTDINWELVSMFFKKYFCHIKDLYNQRNGCKKIERFLLLVKHFCVFKHVF